MSLEEENFRAISGYAFTHFRETIIVNKNTSKVGHLSNLILRHAGNQLRVTKLLVDTPEAQIVLDVPESRSGIQLEVPVNTVRSVSPVRIKLNIPADQLTNYDIAESIGDNEVMYSEYTALRLVEAERDQIGEIKGIYFDEDDIHTLVSGSIFQQVVEELQTDFPIEMMLDTKSITKIDHQKREVIVSIPTEMLKQQMGDKMETYRKQIDEFIQDPQNTAPVYMKI